MNDLQLFNSCEFGQIRMVDIDGVPHAVGVDVAKTLEYAKPSQAVIDHCKGIRKLVIPSAGGMQETNVIPEGDIYRLIIKAADQSKNSAIKAKAERFERWIFDEVLPEIRKTGLYKVPVPQSFAEALRLAADQAEQIEAQTKQIEAAKPKVDFYDAVAGSNDAIGIGEVAKVLGLPGIGRNNLFATLRNKGVLMGNNQPYQEYVDRGYFRVIEQKFTVPNGDTRISIKTLVYQKGVDFIHKMLIKPVTQ